MPKHLSVPLLRVADERRTVTSARRKLNILALVALGSLTAPLGGDAKEFIVSNVSEISAVMRTAHPGDTLTMVDGVWSDARIVFQGSGTSAGPILLRARSYGAVKISGASNLKIAGNYLVVDGLIFQNGYSPTDGVVEFRNSSAGIESNHCRLTNASIVDFNPATTSTDYKWVSMYGTYNRVDHCYLKGKNHSGATLVVWLSDHPNYHLVDHNYFGPRPELGVNGGETIRVGTSDWSLYDSFTTVEYNLFDQCNGEIEIISSKSCGNVYRYNTFVNCQGTLTLRHGNRCRVEGNFFFGNGRASTGGIRIIGEDHVVINNYLSGLMGTSMSSSLSMVDGIVDSPLNGYYQVKRALVAFNTLVNNRVNINIGAGKDADNVLPPLDCTIANNIVYGTTSPLLTFTDTPINLSWQGNIFYGASIGLTPVPAGITVVDPALGNADADGLRHIAGGSAAVNAATGDYPDVTRDMDGQPRDSLKDVGADEYSASPITQRPLKPSDVGPAVVTNVMEQGSIPLQHDRIRLEGAYPNPFNPESTISFSLPVTGRASLDVLNIVGEQVTTLFDGQATGGVRYYVRFNAANQPTGIYFAALTQGNQRAVCKMLHLK